MLRCHFNTLDPRPTQFPPEHPFWVKSVLNHEPFAEVVAYVSDSRQLHTLWPHIKGLRIEQAPTYKFDEDYPIPEWFKPAFERCQTSKTCVVRAWVTCPVCEETDMPETWDEAGVRHILCNNEGCPTNTVKGGTCAPVAEASKAPPVSLTEFELARGRAADTYFRMRPNLQRTMSEEMLFLAGFSAAWHYQDKTQEMGFKADMSDRVGISL